MSNMSVEELIAALGTITAVTQESGTKAATALRALILNVMKDTTSEVEEGVTVTTEQIDSLYSALQKYAPEAIAAAEATGKIIDPMEAIGSLAKAYQDGLLTESELVQLASDIGGKLRTNQLLALIQHWDMFESMMSDMSRSAGSADEKVSIMMDTWDAKAKVLTNTWTEFIAHLIDTSTIKIGLDAVTGFIKVLDSDFGRFAITVAGVTAAVALLSKGIVALETGITALALSQGPLAAGVTTTAAAFKVLTGAMLANPLFWVAGGAAAIYSIVKLVSDLNVTYEEQVQIVKELSQEYDDLYGSGSEYDDLIKRANDLTEAEKNRLAVLEAEKLAMEDLIKMEKQRAADKFQEDWDRQTGNAVTKSNFGGILNYNTEGQKKLAVLKDNVDWLSQSYQKGTISQADYRSGLGELINTYKDTADTIRDYKNNNVELSDSMLAFLDTYDAAAILLSEFADTAGAASDTTTDTAEALDSVAESADAATQAVERYNNALNGLGDRAAGATDIQNKFNKALADFQEGKLGSAELGAWIDAYIPDDVKREFSYNVQDMMDWAMNSVTGRVLTSDNMAAAWGQEIKKAYQNGDLAGIVGMNEDMSQITWIKSYDALAEKMQTTTAFAKEMTSNLDNYHDGVMYTAEEAEQIVGDVGKALAASVGEGTTSLSGFTQALSEITGAKTSTELSGVFERLMENGAIDWNTMFGVSTMDEAMQKVNDYLYSMDAGIDELSENPADIEINFDADEAVAGLNDLESKKKQVEGPAEVQATVTGAEEAEQKLNNVENAKSGAQGAASVAVTADGASAAAGEIGDVSDAASNLPARKNVTINAGGNALGVIDSIKSSMASVRDKTVTITVVEKHVNGKGSTTGGFGLADSGSDGDYHLAQGAEDFVGGKAIVNDGAPVNGSSAELIMDKQGAYIANDGKITAVELEPGARIFNAKETQEIFKDAKKSFISTFAGGGGLPILGGNSSGNGGVYSGSYSGGTGAGGSTASSSSNDALKKEVDEKLDNLDKQIKLAQNRNDKAKEQALQQEAAKLIREYVQKYLDKGYSNTSNEVLDLLNKGYGYSDDLMNELVDALESLTNATDAANKLAEKEQALEKARQELENTKKQRTVRIYNAATQQWEWVAKADDILKAQEKLADAEKDYNDAKLEQELDAIRNGNIGDIGDLTMSPALRELISKASEEEQRRITDILHAISGGATGTVDATGESIFRSTDSHDVYYQFGDLKLSEAEAKNMTVKELADQLRTLSLT